MKRIIRNNLKVFVAILISGIMFTGIGVYAAAQYYANQISFTPSDANKEKGFNATNVEDALNQLYEVVPTNFNEMIECTNLTVSSVCVLYNRENGVIKRADDMQGEFLKVTYLGKFNYRIDAVKSSNYVVASTIDGITEMNKGIGETIYTTQTTSNSVIVYNIK